MKIAIIYTTSNKSTKKSCKILESKLNADIQRIPVEIAKKDCLLKYNLIILAASNNRGKVQRQMRTYISRNLMTLKEKPTALIVNCSEDNDIHSKLEKTFTKELLDTSYIASNFGYELDENNFIEKRKINKLTKNGEELPILNLNEIDKFADYINNMIEKGVD